MFFFHFLPPGGGLFFEVRITNPKPSLSFRCRVTSKHSGRDGWEGETEFGTSMRGILGELLTRADATCCGCWLLSSSLLSDKWQRTETWGTAYIHKHIWIRASQLDTNWRLFPGIYHSRDPSINNLKHNSFIEDSHFATWDTEIKDCQFNMWDESPLQFAIHKTSLSTYHFSLWACFAESQFCQPASGNLFLNPCFESTNPHMIDA